MAGRLLGLGWLAATTTALGVRFDARLAARDRVATRPGPTRHLGVLAAVWVLLLGVLVAAGRVVTGSGPGSPVERLDSATC